MYKISILYFAEYLQFIFPIEFPLYCGILVIVYCDLSSSFILVLYVLNSTYQKLKQ